MNNHRMVNERVRKLGRQQLALIHARTTDIGRWKGWLKGYQLNNQYRDDGYIWLTCVLALKAVCKGNFGVGAVLTYSNGQVILKAHNEVFNPCFHSDRHAEMVIMNKLENINRRMIKLRAYSLYTSLEPCPMCLSRLIVSGIETVLYGAADASGGMVHKMIDLPPVWVRLASRQVFAQAKCSEDLTSAASQIFLLNADKLNDRLTRK